MGTRLGRRVTDLEDRAIARMAREKAVAFGLTHEETVEYLADLRQEIARQRAGLPPTTIEQLVARDARRFGLSDDERRALEVELRAWMAAGAAEGRG